MIQNSNCFSMPLKEVKNNVFKVPQAVLKKNKLCPENGKKSKALKEISKNEANIVFTNTKEDLTKEPTCEEYPPIENAYYPIDSSCM